MPVAKQVATLDHLSEGRFIFGVGVGGEFVKEYEACGVPIGERGPRLTEAIRCCASCGAASRRATRGATIAAFKEVPMQPPGPAARRSADLVRRPLGRRARPRRTPGRRLDRLRRDAGDVQGGPRQDRAGRAARPGAAKPKFGTGHLLFTRLDDTYEKALDAATATLSQRYAMDFRRAAERYAALGSPQQVADRIRAFHAAGVRHVTLDLVGPYEERNRQIEGIARDVLPLLADLRR